MEHQLINYTINFRKKFEFRKISICFNTIISRVREEVARRRILTIQHKYSFQGIKKG